MSAIFGEILTFGHPEWPDVQLKVLATSITRATRPSTGYTAIYDDERGIVMLRGLASGLPIDRLPSPNRRRRPRAPPSGVAAGFRSQARRAAATFGVSRVARRGRGVSTFRTESGAARGQGPASGTFKA